MLAVHNITAQTAGLAIEKIRTDDNGQQDQRND